jgi:hypothetical protein
VTKEQFNLWKHDPVSRVFLAFLKDKREFLINRVSEMWVDGAEVPPAIRGQVIELGEIAELQFEAIESFYKTEEEDGAEPQGSVG